MPRIAEHVVLSKVLDDADPKMVKDSFDGLNALNSLDLVLYLTAGEVFRVQSAPRKYTHFLHSRYRARDDLSNYLVHPDHVALGKQYGAATIEYVMALDWVVDDLPGAAAPPPGAPVRATFLKLKEGLGEEAKKEVLAIIGGIEKSELGSPEQISFGENFSIRCNGFSIGILAVYPDLKSLDSVDTVKLIEEKVGEKLEQVVAFDYIAPEPYSA
ncbi:stress-response A/B barrel domain-containing protein UP3-like [Diospyros lotus]|uniref:stress-response A/B barrel domain-containing protein UP3-like n=1 Tax=Diospyros lotus TaxID=55363 RepID=UPI0022558DFE|nr:stress-response A/B barrel domain-containing protein UP3-like [Diospyros lotus]